MNADTMTEQPFNILAFDTSTPNCSVALIANGALVGEDTRSGPGNYSALLLRMIERLLQDAALAISELDCIAVAQGPGSFTGLRVGISTAQGLGFALTKPLIGVSTLEIVATQNMPFGGNVCAMLDARRGQVYTCLFKGTGNDAAALSEEHVICPEQWASSLQGPVLLCGSGAQVYQETIKRACVAEHYFAPDMNARPRAAMLARIALKRLTAGQGQHPAQVLPGYVRRPDAERAGDVRC
jgi:tRNA threonylcarbamoyladenosine biosynthesis protein TsaB